MPGAKTREEVALAYSSEPWWYDIRGFFILTFAYNSTITSQIRFFGPNFGPRHLEVACGTGTLLELFLRWRNWKKLPPSQIVGIDYAESMLAGAVKRFAGIPSARFHHADAANLPFTDNNFDTANIANSVHCFPDVNGALRDVFRVLKPGGRLAANVLLYPRTSWPFNRIAQRINQWGIRKGILFTPYEKDDIRQRFIDSGFEISTESVTGNCYNILCIKP
ncbi:class I SAM-dependent methyltransferase [Methylococcus mesophilus]|uniref:class I SAM-dependent methyltransferase n=1 Tax=Methylococcus mesophilus TaxID=2993564 RepID=UPI00224B2DC9|nr:class I SAM-dependent methyltransferase [Methylococcus mesophilus]UZR27330.1 methyltransferase domain-containing protein [Methylococcus mesophilus]